MIKTELKNQVCRIIDEHAQQIILLTQEIEKIPELGFKESRTAAAVSKFLSELGYLCQEGLALTGVKTRLKPDSSGPNIAVIGDWMPSFAPTALMLNPLTGAAHPAVTISSWEPCWERHSA